MSTMKTRKTTKVITTTRAPKDDRSLPKGEAKSKKIDAVTTKVSEIIKDIKNNNCPMFINYEDYDPDCYDDFGFMGSFEFEINSDGKNVTITYEDDRFTQEKTMEIKKFKDLLVKIMGKHPDAKITEVDLS